MRRTYHVERKHRTLGWRAVFGAMGSQAFCEGWVAAMDSCYPSDPMRIVATSPGDGDYVNAVYDVVMETKGRGANDWHRTVADVDRATLYPQARRRGK